MKPLEIVSWMLVGAIGMTVCDWVWPPSSRAVVQAAPAKPVIEPAPTWLKEVCYKGYVYIYSPGPGPIFTAKIVYAQLGSGTRVEQCQQ